VLHRPILSGRIGKWAYALIDYDLAFEPLKTLKSQVLVNFIVEHSIDLDDEVNYRTCTPWKLYFDGSVCKDGQGVGIIVVSPNGANVEMSCQLEHIYTNNQTEYEALLFGLEILQSMDVQHVLALGDSLLIVQQVTGVFQCLEGSLNIYLDKCLDIIKQFVEFQIWHIPRHENHKVNMLAQQASDYDVGGRNFHIKTELMHRISTLEAAKPAKPILQCVVADESARLVPKIGQAVCLRVFPRISSNCSLLMLKPIQMVGGPPLLHIYMIQVLKLIRRFGEVLSSLFCIMMNYIRELPKICYLNAWMMIRPEWLWEKSMKVFVVRINWLPR
jgi:ribonuclease HI